MDLSIISPEKNIFSGKVHLVQLPGVVGSFEVLKKHAPLISIMEKGKIKVITPQGEEIFFDINGGVVEVNADVVSVLIT